MSRVLVEVRTSSNRGIQFIWEFENNAEQRAANKLEKHIVHGDVVKVTNYGEPGEQYINFATIQSFSVRELSQD